VHLYRNGKPRDEQLFIGDKRASSRADLRQCAALAAEAGRPRDERLSPGSGQIPELVEQAKARPELRGWFVGRVMQALNGKADINEVFGKVSQTFIEQIAADEKGAAP
jgi:hypothetical protein